MIPIVKKTYIIYGVVALLIFVAGYYVCSRSNNVSDNSAGVKSITNQLDRTKDALDTGSGRIDNIEAERNTSAQAVDNSIKLLRENADRIESIETRLETCEKLIEDSQSILDRVLARSEEKTENN